VQAKQSQSLFKRSFLADDDTERKDQGHHREARKLDGISVAVVHFPQLPYSEYV
jgi:hypothetical protein